MPYRRTAAIQERLDAQRVAIAHAATDLLVEGGYPACSIAAVAARSEVATGTVYRHFASKADLVAAVFRAVGSRELDAVRVAVASADSAADKIVAVIQTFAGRALQAPRLAYALLAEPVDPGIDALRLEFRVAYRDLIAAAIRTGIATGELPPQDATVMAAALVGAVSEVLVGPLSGHGSGPGRELDAVGTLTEFALRGLGVTDVAHA
jgi:AcrR family transcriptional regulator